MSKTRAQIEEGKGRWDPATWPGAINRYMYYKPEYFKMLEAFGKLADESGISKIGLAYRWVRYHSALDGSRGDEMIIGASTAAQFRETVAEVQKGPLEDWVVERLDECWQMVKDVAPLNGMEAAKQVQLVTAS